MVQIGNFHFGHAENANAPRLDVSEAYSLFSSLTLRYDLIQLLQIYHNFTHDPDLKIIVKTAIDELLEKQVNQIEQQMNKFKMVLPKRAPKSVNIESNSQIITDELIFRHSYLGMQYFITIDVQNATRSITNDALRDMYIGFINFEFKHFGNLTKYGKLKGWFESPPIFLTT